MALTNKELTYLEKNLGRTPNEVESDIVGAQWSEHCSYKSSRKYIKSLPTTSPRVILGPGYDAAVLDIGGGYVITVHIESHNHPSSVDPYGGAATGVGGIIRDIISMGTRPIAILDALRFDTINYEGGACSQHSQWLLRNVVRGIADYGNCIGVPTIGGEIEFDSSFKDYCLVDVAAIGLGRRDQIISNRAATDDLIILAGGSTGRDGINGASFASKKLEIENRAAVQIPDPFLEKLLLEAVLEAIQKRCVKAIKDLGGGGLACCLSETSSSLKKGFDIEISDIHVRELGMTPSEIMISESQERMLLITDKLGVTKLKAILEKYGIKYSLIGKVVSNRNLTVRHRGNIIAKMPSALVAHAPLVGQKSTRPAELCQLRDSIHVVTKVSNLTRIILSLLSNPTISGKEWVYQQFDSEVGIRTVLKPGMADSSVLKLDNGKFLSVKLDGNSKQCNLDPYLGTLNCLSEACRNVVSTGANPIGIIDHLQFGSPEKPEIYWGFMRAIDAIIDYCTFMKLPVVGGKVSFYNETPKGPIKHSPVIGAIGLIEKQEWIKKSRFLANESIFLIGSTKDELGGSEYYEAYHKFAGGSIPHVDLKTDKLNSRAVLKLIESNIVNCVHDCSKGGLAVALCEMALQGSVGFKVSIDSIPNSCSSLENLLFSESSSRYLVGTKDPQAVDRFLSSCKGVIYSNIGLSTDERGHALFCDNESQILIDIPYGKIVDSFATLDRIMDGRIRNS